MSTRTGLHADLRFDHDTLANRVVFGAGRSRSDLVTEVDALGGSRVLLLATGREGSLARELTDELGDRVVGRFTGV
jgi:maleylacetate reductase